MENTIVKVSSLSKKYEDTTVVDEISFSIDKGEILGLIGPNGAGKTTTVLMLTTYLSPDKGYFEVNGISSKDTKRIGEIKKTIGYVPQEIALYDDMNAVENLLFFGKMYDIERKELKNEIDSILEQVGLADKRKQLVKHFSGGMKRRLNIAAALLHKPKFVILDEPTVGIDPQSRNRIFDIVKTLKANGTSVLYITHYMEEAHQLCDRIAIMDNGRLVALDTIPSLINLVGNHYAINIQVDNLKELPNDIKVRLGANEVKYVDGILSLQVSGVKDMIPRFLSDLYASGADIKKIEIKEPDLQQVFLQLTGKNLRD